MSAAARALPDIVPPLEGGAARAPLVRGANPLTPRQAVIVDMLARGHGTVEIARRLGISIGCVKHHLAAVGKKIPGDLALRMKIILWYRGASEDSLTGASLERIPSLEPADVAADDDEEAQSVLAAAGASLPVHRFARFA